MSPLFFLSNKRVFNSREGAGVALFDKYLIFGLFIRHKVLNYVKNEKICLFQLLSYILSTIAATVYNSSKVFFVSQKKVLKLVNIQTTVVFTAVPTYGFFMASSQIARSMQFDKMMQTLNSYNYWIVLCEYVELK